DLLVNEDTRRTFLLRSRLVGYMRCFLDARGFVEVETPILQPLYGGCAAHPFITHFNVLDEDLYLRIALELYLKRLIIGGLDRVYEIGHNFRNEGFSRQHSPEYTMLELYQAYADYTDMMALCETLIEGAARELLGTTRLPVAGREVDLAAPWPRVPLNDPIEQRARFLQQQEDRAHGDEEAHTFDEDFLLALEHGMPPTGGIGIGLDRVTMVFTGATNIRDVILFPHLRRDER